MHIDRILQLARIQTSKEEKQNLEKDFSSILDFVKKLETADVKDVKPMAYPVELYNVMREDKEKRTNNDQQKTKKIIDAAPETKDGYIKVKQVL
jgi:aspartyl-tRNA(Asn)/glutamyl-tRNA(Gln) amidotransferase subunit C